MLSPRRLAASLKMFVREVDLLAQSGPTYDHPRMSDSGRGHRGSFLPALSAEQLWIPVGVTVSDV